MYISPSRQCEKRVCVCVCQGLPEVLVGLLRKPFVSCTGRLFWGAQQSAFLCCLEYV